ncbi:DUF4349 domain-containing protein [Micromonospora sp. CB01531]|uniref:DUF4349 domain-containing protein n=1 Tax=Micromonospora sp. CB01531 TaxID=1718947 RepID=UPI00093D822B|nr:DUF4349 domain-containing protein [Micromonospora sp. CB01531]OKI42213.1 hypothetical protein A6A27_12860 [Micromonospora sp. CB01531]
MNAERGRRRAVSLAVVGLAVVLAAGACGADSGQNDQATSAEAPAAGAAQDKAGAGADRDAAAPAPAGSGGAQPDLRVDQRSIIYTGTLQVRVDDVEKAARAATDAATAAGGFVGGDQRHSEAADARAELTLRVPADRFTAVVDELSRLGQPEQREVRTEDVTEETVDLDARIATQRARVDSARKLLARASSINELVTLENEVGRREADLASLEAKKRRLADLTALSTITVAFVGTDATTAEEGTELGFLVGLRGGWDVFVTTMFVLLTVLGAVLPFAVVIGVPVVLLVRAARRRRARRAPPAGPAPTVPGPAGPVGGPAPSAPPPVPAARSGP